MYYPKPATASHDSMRLDSVWTDLHICDRDYKIVDTRPRTEPQERRMSMKAARQQATLIMLDRWIVWINIVQVTLQVTLWEFDGFCMILSDHCILAKTRRNPRVVSQYFSWSGLWRRRNGMTGMKKWDDGYKKNIENTFVYTPSWEEELPSVQSNIRGW